MKTMIKLSRQNIGYYLMCILCLLLFVLQACGENSDPEKERIEAFRDAYNSKVVGAKKITFDDAKKSLEERDNIEKEIPKLSASLIKTYGAKLYPPDEFRDKRIFTYNLRKYLFSEEGKPIIFRAQLDDVTEENGRFIAHFSTNLGFKRYKPQRIYLNMSCDYNKISGILNNPPSDRVPLFVVCEIKNLRKIISFKTEAIEGEYIPQVKIDTPIEYILEGNLLNLTPLL